jgi:hypothetical protein
MARRWAKGDASVTEPLRSDETMKRTSSVTVDRSDWRFISNHGVVLLAIARTADVRIHELAATTGITERACQKIVNDLRGSGYVSARRVGRRNVYTVDGTLPMRHPALQALQVTRLLELWDPGREAAPEAGERQAP